MTRFSVLFSLIFAAVSLVGCLPAAPWKDSGGITTQELDSSSDAGGTKLTKASVTLYEGYCSIDELTTVDGANYSRIFDPYPYDQGSGDDLFYEGLLGSVLFVFCDASVTPQFTPSISWNADGCAIVYDGEDEKDLIVYVYPSSSTTAENGENCFDGSELP